jgi:chromosome partitioning protein
MIFTTGGIKGGSGKTTLATNLAVYLASKGRDVLAVDADDQGSFIRQSDKEVRSEVLKLASKFDDIVIDTGGRDTASQRAALSITDVYLVPFYPRSLDVWTAGDVEKLVSEMQIVNPKLKAFTFINRADPKGGDNKDVSDLLKESKILTHLDAPLINRKAFANAISFGLAIFELKPQDEKANAEFRRLFDSVFQELKMKPL